MKCKIMYSYCRMNKKISLPKIKSMMRPYWRTADTRKPPKHIFSFDTRLVILILLLVRVSKWMMCFMPHCSYFPFESFSEPSAQSEDTERGLPPTQHRRHGARGVCDYRRTDPIASERVLRTVRGMSGRVSHVLHESLPSQVYALVGTDVSVCLEQYDTHNQRRRSFCRCYKCVF
jgi:hypothetical protein